MANLVLLLRALDLYYCVLTTYEILPKPRTIDGLNKYLTWLQVNTHLNVIG